MQAIIDTPIGAVGLSWDGETVTGVDLEPQPRRNEPGHNENGHNGAEPPPSIIDALGAYFLAGSHCIDLPVDLRGTPFQLRVWQALRGIDPGETRTYGALARALGTSPRALGGACRANPCPIIVPCHRVVAADGLGGFAGDKSGRKLAIKRWLLEHEGVALHA